VQGALSTVVPSCDAVKTTVKTRQWQCIRMWNNSTWRIIYSCPYLWRCHDHSENKAVAIYTHVKQQCRVHYLQLSLAVTLSRPQWKQGSGKVYTYVIGRVYFRTMRLQYENRPTSQCSLVIILKRSRDFLLCTKKEPIHYVRRLFWSLLRHFLVHTHGY